MAPDKVAAHEPGHDQDVEQVADAVPADTESLSECGLRRMANGPASILGPLRIKGQREQQAEASNRILNEILGPLPVESVPNALDGFIGAGPK
jgi:hypothetical protein